MQARSHPEHAAAERGHHRLFFFGLRKRGVRPHPPNPPWLRAWTRHRNLTRLVSYVLLTSLMVLHGRWTYFEANSRDGGEESFQDEACDGDDDTDGGVAGEENRFRR